MSDKGLIDVHAAAMSRVGSGRGAGDLAGQAIGSQGSCGTASAQFKKIRVKGVSTLTFSDGMLVVPPLIAFVMWWLNTQGGRSGIRMFSLYRSSQGAKKDGPRTKLMVSHIPHIGPTASGGVKGSSSMIAYGQ